MRLLSYLRLTIKFDFVRSGVPSWMHREYFLKCERQQLCYEILKRLQVQVRPTKYDFNENRVSSLNKIAWTLSLKLQYECQSCSGF